MATLPKAGAVTLLDFAKSLDPNGNTATVVELLNQTNEILIDMQWMEGNLPTGHRTTVRTGLPNSTWRTLYSGVQPSKSVRAQVDDSIGMLEARAEVDKDVADLNGNTNDFRLSEAQAFLESMNQNFGQTLFYGDASVNPERFTGLSPRYSSLSAGNAQNILSAGGTTTLTSIWLIVWAKTTISGIFPKGSKAGIFHEDLGLIDAFDSATPAGRYRAYADHWQWKGGITVRDWRYAVRIANVDVTALVAQTGTQALTAATHIHRLMLRSFARIPAMGMGKAVFYMNRTVKEMLSVAALDRSNAAVAIMPAVNQFGDLSPGSVANGTLTFFGVLCRTCDQILSTESQVS